MAIVINGSGTVTGITAGGLPDGIITADELASGVGGKVLQVVQGETNVNTTSTTSTFIDSTLEASITPSSTSNKILVYINIPQARKANNTTMNARLLRDSTNIYDFQIYGLYTADTSTIVVPVTATFLDSPSSTSELTYKIMFASAQNISYVKMQSDSVISTITLMEIAG